MLHVASLDILARGLIKKKTLIRLRGCAGWSAPFITLMQQSQAFSRRGILKKNIQLKCFNSYTFSVLLKCFIIIMRERYWSTRTKVRIYTHLHNSLELQRINVRNKKPFSTENKLH